MSLSDQLRSAIAHSGKTHDRLGHDSGVTPHVIDRFVSGERSLNLATADKLATALGLALAESEKPVDSH